MSSHTTEKKYISRREIAELAEVSKDTVKRLEKEWGIWAYRKRVPGMLVFRYRRGPTLTLLRAKGIIQA